jgi:hypothetical protein
MPFKSFITFDPSLHSNVRLLDLPSGRQKLTHYITELCSKLTLVKSFATMILVANVIKLFMALITLLSA